MASVLTHPSFCLCNEVYYLETPPEERQTAVAFLPLSETLEAVTSGIFSDVNLSHLCGGDSAVGIVVFLQLQQIECLLQPQQYLPPCFWKPPSLTRWNSSTLFARLWHSGNRLLMHSLTHSLTNQIREHGAKLQSGDYRKRETALWLFWLALV